MAEDLESTQQPARSGPSSGTEQGTGPVGCGNYEVQQGDCIESIAFSHGHFWQTIWNHTENQQLKSRRKDHNVLLAGDRVFIPDPRAKHVSGATEQRHRFRRKGVPSSIRILVKDQDKPRANERYMLEIEGQLFPGRTDAQGALKHPIPPNAKRGKLVLGTEGEEYYLKLGNLDPVSETTGLQSRLKNLGFDCAVTGQLDDQTREAIRAFEQKHGLDQTGEPSSVLQEKLKRVHES